ncbi:hypothetical protein [Paraburkholderia terricola]|uniref:Uncharacterized protein n=1 Tax=Paraburkholderia terricola TaxID=169427 RepID=A0ABU1LMJ3_9BURK|nr:hypothetical protein [Paraburkholderia terricola]MDR6407947.1 hypothetical protein [Paraburkholderia terricola]MDR6444638.1 hypothetical protein [Paraburkholderia terricola]MDR6479838.1 hypothetical protein [Paraburkholderia terricola]
MIFALPFFASAMVFVFSCLSWLFFNVGVPVFGPIALLPLLSLSRVFRRASQGIAIKAIKDGQLLWVVISMCASACYEIGSALGDARTDGSLASILVSFAAADAVYHPARNDSEEPRDRRLMWFSLFMTAAVAASFSASHYSLA